MTPTDHDIAEVVRKLTKAQRDGLLRKPCPSWWGQTPAAMPYSDQTGIALKKRGLVVASGTRAWPLTQLGIAVRAALAAMGEER